MNILLLGSGGREHVLAWKLAQSPILQELFIAPGNAGTAHCGINVPLNVTDFPGIRDFVLENSVSMVIVGPEDPLVQGIHDFFLADVRLANIAVIGPVAEAAKLEGSKEFAKKFMNRHGIPTAAHRIFNRSTFQEGVDFIESANPPFVLKADGLAAGKGVVICTEAVEAKKALTSMILERKFGPASENVVIEEFLTGIELSVFILTDGISYKLLPVAKDYKKIGEHDTGPNTGGMGSVSPVPFADGQFMKKVEERIIKPTIEGLKKEKIDYCGFIFFGLIKVNDEPFVIEYNCRMGDPEAESVIPRINNDLLQLFTAVAEKRLEKEILTFNTDFAATIMLVAKGYPEQYEKGKVISGEKDITDSLIFHAGTAFNPIDSTIRTNGGRVIAVTSLGKTMKDALESSYRNAEKVLYEGKYYRKDLGFDL
jgi:phosphoribosylamine---glycine ligase